MQERMGLDQISGPFQDVRLFWTERFERVHELLKVPEPYKWFYLSHSIVLEKQCACKWTGDKEEMRLTFCLFGNVIVKNIRVLAKYWMQKVAYYTQSFFRE